MGFFDMFKKKAKEGATEAIDKVKEMPKEDIVNNVADAVKQVTPDSIDKKVDQVAQTINDKIQ